MINRKLYKDNISCQPTEWNSAVKIAVALPKIAVISIGNVYSEATMTLSSTVNVKFIQPFTGHVTLTVCILEDSLYGGQENNVPPQPIPIIENYLFMHVLRGSLNGSFGELIVANPTVNSVFSKQYSLNFSENTWIPKHCHVLAYISDEDTYEILHVAKAAVIK
jgi:hypothetical protein